ncbi:MAG: GrpB family protein [Chloroflexi bacterium]|nr:GrpB family protein [Chloroflexota bacterium]
MAEAKRPIVRVPAETRLAVVPYDPGWPAMYERERAEIAACIGQHILCIEHAGSTAIPGMAGKPTIDILVGVHEWDEARVTFGPLAKIGWEFRGERGMPRRHFFRRLDAQGRRTHQLHMLEVTHPQWEAMLLFRDYVRSHPDAAAEYQRLKLDLARRFPDSRGQYTVGKEAFVMDVLAQARRAREDRRDA